MIETSYHLRFEVPGLPKMANGNKGGHWAVRAKATAMRENFVVRANQDDLREINQG